MLKRIICIMLFLFLAASGASARTIEGVDLPETLTFGNITLGLNGGGGRVAFFNKVYVAGLYLQHAMTDPDQIIEADEPMAIRMHVINDFFASSKHVTHALYKGFRGSMPKGDLTPIKTEVERFNACFSEKIVDGQEFDVLYVPNKGTSVYKDGVLKDTIPGYEFKKHVFAIWLGKRPADKKLKKGMLAGDFRVAIAKTSVAKAAEQAEAKAEKVATAEEAVQMKAAEKVKAAEAAKAEVEQAAAGAEKAGAEAAEQASAEKASLAKAAQMKAAEQAKAEEALKKAEAEKARAEAAKKAAAEKARAEAAKKAAAEKAAMEARAKAAEQARLKAEAEKRAAQAKALEAREKKASIPVTSVTEAQVTGEDVMFGFNSAALSAKARRILKRKVDWLLANPGKNITIQVFCDPCGSRAYNEYLAGKRAQSVVKYLTAAGISKDRIEVLGFKFGKTRRAHFAVK